MSTRIALPMVNFGGLRMSDRQHTLPLLQAHTAVNTTSAQETSLPRNVRRNLFGPVDHERKLQNREFVRNELRKIHEADREKYNFNFTTDSPISGGRFIWEPVSTSEVPLAYCNIAKDTISACNNSSSISNNTITTISNINNNTQVTSTKNPPIISNKPTCSTSLTKPVAIKGENSVNNYSEEINKITNNTSSTATTPNTKLESTKSNLPNNEVVKNEKKIKSSKQPLITEFAKIKRKRSSSPPASSKIASNNTTTELPKRRRTSQ